LTHPSVASGERMGFPNFLGNKYKSKFTLFEMRFYIKGAFEHKNKYLFASNFLYNHLVPPDKRILQWFSNSFS